ncbi:hypothetical protein [Bdellovibrio bacteriovorus]|uniref:hypothetical protein n=1 Tax=Bdellovibrio bacteriovorus TaxID=959 RepID=UPI0035A5B7CE
MSNFPIKKSEKQSSNNVLDLIAVGAAVKTAIDVGAVRDELQELKKIEQDRASAEARDRKEAKSERDRLQCEQRRHQGLVEEEMNRRAAQETESFSKAEESRILHEIEEIVRLNLGIKQEHYEAVKNLARKIQAPREEAAEKFRTDVISRGLGMLLRSEFCPPEQRYEKVIETCPRFPKDESFVESYLLVCLESDLNLTQAYEVFTADQDEREQREKSAKAREDGDKRMIELRLGTDAALLESVGRQISKFSEIEKQLGESAKMKRRASQKWQILGLGSVLVATFVSVCLLFREEGWKAGVTFGALVGLIVTWGIYELLKTTGLIFPRYYEESWFKGVNSNVLRRALSVSSMDISNLRMRAP